MRWSIEELIRYWRYYNEHSVWNWFKYFFHNCRRRIRLVFKWIFTGYCSESTWSLHEYFSEVILFRLKAFKKMKKYGHPSQMSSIEEWHEKIDLIIEKFEILVNNSIQEGLVYPDKTLIKEVVDGKEVNRLYFGNEEQREANMKIYEAQSKNDSEAIEMFAELFWDLWD